MEDFFEENGIHRLELRIFSTIDWNVLERHRDLGVSLTVDLKILSDYLVVLHLGVGIAIEGSHFVRDLFERFPHAVFDHLFLCLAHVPELDGEVVEHLGSKCIAVVLEILGSLLDLLVLTSNIVENEVEHVAE